MKLTQKLMSLNTKQLLDIKKGLQAELEQLVNDKGYTNGEVIAKSQELDRVVASEMLELNKKYLGVERECARN